MLRFWVCLALIVLLFPSTETRSLNLSLVERILRERNEALIKNSRELLDIELGKDEDTKVTTGYKPS